MTTVRLKPHGNVFLFFFSVVVPPAKGLELLRFVVEVPSKVFFQACPFRLLPWFLGAIRCGVHTIEITVLGGMCTASDHQKPAIHIKC